MAETPSRDHSELDERPTVGLLIEGRYMSQSQPSGMLASLRARGARVRVIDPEAAAYPLGEDTWLDGLDLLVCRGRSVALRFLLRWAELKGVPCINRHESIASVFNKAEMSAALAAGSIPTPVTFLGPLHELATLVPESAYPVILKPVYGDNCRGLRMVRSASEMMDVTWAEPLALAQRFHSSDGYDLKLYGIGGEVWAVRKPSCLAAALGDPLLARGEAAPHPVPLTAEMKRLALRCAELFGLELFGVDCVETSEGILVIEVNDFPNYTSIPGVDDRLADFVLQYPRARKVR